MNYPAAELRGIKMNFYLINPDAKHRGILLIKRQLFLNRRTAACDELSRVEQGTAEYRSKTHGLGI